MIPLNNKKIERTSRVLIGQSSHELTRNTCSLDKNEWRIKINYSYSAWAERYGILPDLKPEEFIEQIKQIKDNILRRLLMLGFSGSSFRALQGY